jgi:hypothetical protein
MLVRLHSCPTKFSTMHKALKHASQHDSHHVVSMLCVKRPQIQKTLDYLYNLQSHIYVQKEDLNFKWVKDFKLVRKLQ